MTKTIPWLGVTFILLISAIAIIGLLFIIYAKETQTNLISNNSSYFIIINAVLNSASATFIFIGKWAINKRKITLHKKMMITAFVFSSLFLISYIYYHYNHGNTLFLGQGIIRNIYFLILFSHLILATITLPAVLITFYFALSSRFQLHKSIAIYTIYAWLYVSISGVLIYLLLQIFTNQY